MPPRNIAGKKWRVPFADCNKLQWSYSQAGQDIFVLSVLHGLTQGKYLELGCWMPQEINNSYLLESLGWTGMSFDKDEPAVNYFNSIRKNKAYASDCTKLDFNFIEENMGNCVDYMSIDLEPADVTLQCLKNIPFDSMKFKVITFEHDKYRFGDAVRNESRKIFCDAGYGLVVSDLGEPACNAFEDWYVKDVDRDHIKPFYMHNPAPEELLFE
jgi:hypothetical protein